MCGKMTDERKAGQERIVGNALADAYCEVTGSPLLPVSCNAPDPPDLFFEWKGTAVGVAAFELHQFHGQRSLYEGIAAKAQLLIASRADAEDYTGVVVSLGRLLDSKGRDAIAQSWKSRGVKRPIDKAAEELASTLLKHFPPGSISQRTRGRVIQLDPSSQPALHALVRHVVVERCGVPEEPRSVPWPRIVASPGYTYDPAEMERWVVEAVVKKADSRRRNQGSWHLVAHSILAAHDLPRDRLLRTFSIPWASYLKTAVSRTEVMSEYDELWLVSFGNLHGSGIRVGGGSPKR